MYTITELNQMSQEAFIEALGAIFEHTPQIAAQVWHKRPFLNIADLHQKMLKIVETMSQEEQMALICAHPDLASKAKMADASVQEQSDVGLNQLTPEEYDHFQRMNQLYRDRFGFPFLIAVRNHTKDSILEAFERRLNNPLDVEKQQTLQEISEIARFRLITLIGE